jgi:hypothetical protein
VQLADYVVTYSLQLNNRCLRYLADCDVRGGQEIGVEVDTIRPDVSVYAESLLTRDSRRLASMWDLLRPAIGADFASHIERIEHTAKVLTGGPAQNRLALRLASIAAEEAQAQALVKVVRSRVANETEQLTWDALNELYLQDSEQWRRIHRLAPIDDDTLIRRIVRSYRKGYRCRREYAEQEAGRLQNRWLGKHAGDWLEWAQHTVHQLELLRPRLSDKGKAQLWYLEKLADTLRTRVGLTHLRVEIKVSGVDKFARKIAQEFVDQQIEKMDRRLDRLLSSSYSAKPKRVAAMLTHAVEGDVLDQVALLSVPRPRTERAKSSPEVGNDNP